MISGDGAIGYKASIRNLCAPFHLKNLLVYEETLQPGMSASRLHFHTLKEEMIIVLEGKLRVTCGESSKELESGSVFGFPPGPGNAHFLTNIGPCDARYLSIGTASELDKAVYV